MITMSNEINTPYYYITRSQFLSEKHYVNTSRASCSGRLLHGHMPHDMIFNNDCFYCKQKRVTISLKAATIDLLHLQILFLNHLNQ